jgi:predicted CXXCH cytochrome family protein
MMNTVAKNLILAGLVAWALRGPAAPAQEPAPAPPAAPAAAEPVRKVAAPTTAIPATGCVTAECHPGVKEHRAVHAPVAGNGCDACHTLADPAKHTFTHPRTKTEMCTFCHKMDLSSAAVIHKPLTTGDCLQCHSPHGGNGKQFLRGPDMNALCEKCHASVTQGKRTLHGPVAAMACGACHGAHSAPLPKLLLARSRDLCLSCHAEMDAVIKQAKYPHKAAAEDCVTCHEPHAANYPMLTRRPPVQMCTDACHATVKKEFADAKFPHGAIFGEQGCLSCHTPHGGNLARLMRATPIDVCMTCHDKKIERPGLTAVAGLPEVLDPKEFKHGPIAQGSCSGCHSPHGGDNETRLTKAHPETFYATFDVEKYALCFTCHESQLALMSVTRTVTRFRNGDQNLHYLHVNRARGRSCRACHSTHASRNPMHVQESVPYGNWQIPIRFVPSSTGGQCAAGCHQALGYDRETPVVYQKAATPEAGPPAAVNPEPPVAPDAGQPVAPAPVPTVPKAQETQP